MYACSKLSSSVLFTVYMMAAAYASERQILRTACGNRRPMVYRYLVSRHTCPHACSFCSRRSEMTMLRTQRHTRRALNFHACVSSINHLTLFPPILAAATHQRADTTPCFTHLLLFIVCSILHSPSYDFSPFLIMIVVATCSLSDALNAGMSSVWLSSGSGASSSRTDKSIGKYCCL